MTAPATLLAGKWDLLTAWDEVVAAAGRLPDAEVHVLPGSHFLPLEYPERIVAEVHDLAVRAGESGGLGPVAEQRRDQSVAAAVASAC